MNNYSTNKFLICKILNIHDGNMYQLICQSGILEICYSASELELVDNQDIPELRNTPTIRVSIREAARLQNVVDSDDNTNNRIVCACKKSKCKNRVCPCRKNNNMCSTHCHKNSACLNKKM